MDALSVHHINQTGKLNFYAGL